ncbi:MAG: hypothetical protein PVF27_08975 [Gemmatimonadales bacterium]|jgi:hypothetical protein
MELLVCVINREEKLEEILAGFAELGVSGATVVNSEGMARLIAGELPVLSDLQSLLARSRPQNTTVFSVMESGAMVDRAIRVVEDALGDLSTPATGIVFTVPVARVAGLADRAGSDE